MVEFVTRIVALPVPVVSACVPKSLWAIVHVSTTISTGCVCDAQNADTPLLLLANTELRTLMVAVPKEPTTPRLVLYSNRLLSMTEFEFVLLVLLFITPVSLLRNSQLFTIRFDPAAS